jgi:crotonobetainyl-CoA:carnitine CoA-transferase CaiB-like acyl-CoA transferase
MSGLADCLRPTAKQDMPLAGVVVVEWCTSLAGAYAGRLLGDLGATVIKVEDPAGDPSRAVGTTAGPALGYGSLFLYCNSGKFAMTLDLAPPAGTRLFRRLMNEADVLLSDATATVLEARGMTARQIEQGWPRLIHLSVRPYGLTGSRAELDGYDLDVFHSAGEGKLMPGGLSYEMFPDRQPLIAGHYSTSYDGGTAAATVVCAALVARFTTGRGTVAEVSMQDVQIGLNRVNLDLQLNNGIRLDRAHRGYDFGGIFPCKDGYITVRPNEDRQWAALAVGMGRADLIEDPRFSTRAARESNAGELNDVVAGYAAGRTRDQIYAELSAAGAPAGTFDEPARIVRSPQFTARHWFRRLSLHGRELLMPSAPYQMSETPPLSMRAAPGLGEHNGLIYPAIGVTDDARRELSEEGVI